MNGDYMSFEYEIKEELGTEYSNIKNKQGIRVFNFDGHPVVSHVKLPEKIKKGGIFNVYHLNGHTKTGCEWLGDLRSSIDDCPELQEPEWIVTDPDCKQRYRIVAQNCFLFEEERIVDPVSGRKDIFSAKINLSEHSQDEMFDHVKHFGYSFNEMCSWLDDGVNLSLIAECIFEGS